MPTDLLTLFTPTNIILFIVVFTRIGGLFSSAPLFSTYPIPNQIKMWLVASIAFIMYPLVVSKGSFVMPTAIPELFIILLKEFAIGYTIGFCANIIFVSVEIAASLFSMQMGLTASQALDPVSQSSTPVFGQAYTLLVAMVFLCLNAHQWLFGAVYQSFNSVPPGYEFIFSPHLVEQVMYMSGQMFSIGMGIALPIFSVLLITDILLGFVSKMMPQMNIFMVSMPLKIYMGITLTIIFLDPIANYTRVLLEQFLTGIMALF